MIDSLPGVEDLTPRQRQAVYFRGGNLLVEAVPGSGKTRVIVARCSSLIAQGVPFSSILLLTFSGRAAGEIRSRLELVLERQVIPDIRTFHGFAARLLADAGNAGRARRLLSEPAERALFAYVANSVDLPSFPRGIGRSASFCDIASARVDEIRRSSPEAIARLLARATPRLRDLLALERSQADLRNRHNFADYDDLVAQAVKLASTPGSAVSAALKTRYRHVLVDEFQDTDPLQLALLEQFGAAEIFAVGDKLQAIYGFRGAARNALGHAKAALAMETLPLDESFRCPTDICKLAGSVWPSEPALHSQLREPGNIEFRRTASPQDEAAFLGERIASEIAAGTAENAIAVLVRTTDPTLRLVEDDLRSRGIAVARQGGEHVLDDLAVDAICAALKALARPNASEGWEQLFTHPAFGIPVLALRRSLNVAPPMSLEDACAIGRQTGSDGRVSGTRFAAALQSAHAHWDAHEPVKAARCFAAETNLLGFVTAGSEDDARRSSSNILSFLEGLGDVRDLHRDLGLETSSSAILTAFLSSSEKWRTEGASLADEPGVRLLTVHAAKGLEFDFVAIADVVDDRFPQRWRPDELLTPEELELGRECGVDIGTAAEEHLAEERSLWYVAVTRSKQRLLITWSATAMDGSPQRASGFIPLDRRKEELEQPPFRSLLAYSAVELAQVQVPSSAHLSRAVPPSALEAWLDCRRKFYYRTLLRIDSEERGFKAKLGTLVHRAIHEFHREVYDFRAVRDEAHVAWSARLNEIAGAVLSSDAFTAFDSTLETEAALRSATRLLTRYARELERSARTVDGGFRVAASEEHVTFVVNGVSFSGRIDRIDQFADGALALIDVKTGAFKKDKAMAATFLKLKDAVDGGTLWTKPTPPANPQLPLYRSAKPDARRLEYLYLEARPKADEFCDLAYADYLDVAQHTQALAAIDEALFKTFFEPWTTGEISALTPTANSRSCRYCEFEEVCPGYLEDDD